MQRLFLWGFALTLIIAGLLYSARRAVLSRIDSAIPPLWQDLGVSLILSSAAFGAVALVLRRQLRLQRQHQELLALDQASEDIQSELALERLLEKVTEQARQLIGARYGALSVIDGDSKILQFITAGITAEQRQRIGPPPRGRGVLGAVLEDGERLRLPKILEHPRSVGFPEHHPPMQSLLAVPLPTKTDFRGNLYLADKDDSRKFTPEDERSLVRFAAKAAQAIDNAFLHQQMQALAVAEERVRLSREMHDGTAQMLAYVNTKAQAVQEFLRRGKNDLASSHLDQLAQASREVYADVREGIAALRTEVGPKRPLKLSLKEYVDSWQDRTGIRAEISFEGEPHVSPHTELQLLRVVQEALTNVRKHAEAKSVTVNLVSSKGQLCLRITDDGCGFDPDSPESQGTSHYGLTIMGERAQAIGGKLQLRSAPGAGTTIELLLDPEPGA